MSDDELTNPDEPAYEVGYKRPPKQRQFKKGKSGNPRGLPKGSKGFATLVRENLAKPVQVKLDGRLQTVSFGEAILMRTLRDAVSGGKRAAEQGLKLMERFGPPDEQEAASAWDLSLLTEEELIEMHRITCKATNQMEDFYEWEDQRKRERKEFDEERVRIFGPSVLLGDDEG